MARSRSRPAEVSAMTSGIPSSCPRCGLTWDTRGPDGVCCIKCGPFSNGDVLKLVPMTDSSVTRLSNDGNRETEKRAFRLSSVQNLLNEPEEPTPYLVDGLLVTSGTSICGAKP